MRIGPYEVLGELGRGGMGVVHRARAGDGREVAVKVLARSGEPSFARFERERRLLASLGEAEGFVPLLDAGVTGETAWLVMPFVPGGTLRQKLVKGPLGVDETVALGLALARALGAAHERGIVHRDVKPENILFTREGRPLLADLGLAKHFDRNAQGASQSVDLSRSGTIRGTAGYMAPEQLEDAMRAGPAADVFALGAVLYECLEGRPAFEGETVVDMLSKVTSGSVEPFERASVPRWLEEIVARALAREPRARFPDGGALARTLDARKAAPAVVPGSRRALLLPLALGIAVGGAALGIGLALQSRSASVEERAPRKERERGLRRPVPPRAWELVAHGDPRARSGDLDGAIADYTRAIELEPTFTAAWANRGWARGQKGDCDGAIADFTKAIELEPTCTAAWANRGWARGQKGNADGAIADCTRAIELTPELAKAWAVRAHARGVKGDQDGDIADATKAIELDPAFAPAWESRGWARCQRDDYDGAIADTTKALELDPKLALAWTARATARAEKGELDGAIADATKAIELDPKVAMAWGIRGTAWGGKGDLSRAIADSTKAIELDPRLFHAWRNRGVARLQTGDTDGAASDFERFLELAPGDPAAPQVRAKLAELKAQRPR
jgi:tetratricopeptide (TPR) repeat protein